MSTIVKMPRAAALAINAVFADFAAAPGKIARRGNSTRTAAFVPATHPHYAALAEKMKEFTPRADGSKPAGIMVVEWLTPHPDGLSVTGYYLVGNDDFAPASKLIWVAANADGTPNLDCLCRAGGMAAKAMSGAWA